MALIQMKIARVKKGISQKQLSEISNLSSSTISNIESGSKSIDCVSFGTLKKISEALDISIDELIKEEI